MLAFTKPASQRAQGGVELEREYSPVINVSITNVIASGGVGKRVEHIM